MPLYLKWRMWFSLLVMIADPEFIEEALLDYCFFSVVYDRLILIELGLISVKDVRFVSFLALAFLIKTK